MGWSVGFDSNWNRDIGYGVPAYCDHPGCMAEIDRGLAYVCCDGQPHGGARGCGLYFCPKHSDGIGRCEQCAKRRKAKFAPTPDHPDWIRWKLKDASWKQWRRKNPSEVVSMLAELAEKGRP